MGWGGDYLLYSRVSANWKQASHSICWRAGRGPLQFATPPDGIGNGARGRTLPIKEPALPLPGPARQLIHTYTPCRLQVLRTAMDYSATEQSMQGPLTEATSHKDTQGTCRKKIIMKSVF